MKRSWLIRLKEKLVSRSRNPWACFETTGPNAEGRIEFSISWNMQFIKQLRAAGFEADTEEAMVQMFFVSARMIPEQSMLPDIDEDVVNPEEMPNLTNDANILKR